MYCDWSILSIPSTSFCIFLLYRTDPQVEVQIRILLKEAAIKVVFLVKSKYQVLAEIRFLCVCAFFSRIFVREFFSQQIQIVYTASFQSFCNKSGSVGRPTNPLNSSMRSILWETIVWIYNLTVMIVSQKIKSFLYKQKLVNNCIIPSTHAERKITIRSHKHSFTPYPSLSPY